MRKSKQNGYRKLWLEPCASPSSTGQKVIISKIRGQEPPQVTYVRLSLKIKSSFFSKRRKWAQANGATGYALNALDYQERITTRDLWPLCIPGSNRISNKALKLGTKIWPNWFISPFESGIVEGILPSQCKRQKLILLPKSQNYLACPFISLYLSFDYMRTMLQRVRSPI